ncbi:MAG: DMT family transporter [Notoacmeibacter sp.]|nr:DMT family transporter [Notoacmeibacter sp.]
MSCAVERTEDIVIPVTPSSPIVPSAHAKPVQNGRGILLMAFGFFLFSAVDTQAKFLAQDFHPIQIVWIRQLGLLVGMFWLLGWHGTSILRTARPGMQVIRGALAVISATIFIFAVREVPLADAVAVSFVAPFIVTIFGALILREPVGIRRWVAVAIGFAGTLIIIRPGAGVLHPAILLVVVAAALFSARQILSRMLAAQDRTATTVAYTALTGSLLLTLALPFVWAWPTNATQWLLFVSIAAMAAVAELMVIKALEIAQAVAVAPMQYTMMIWGTFYGYLVFGQLPDFWTLVGAAVIIATGIYVINRERIAAREGHMRMVASREKPGEPS